MNQTVTNRQNFWPMWVAEKTRKVERVRSRYPQWWLALVDHIGYGGLDPFDLEQLRSIFQVEDPWAKIILVTPLDSARGFEL
jgi:hypothetical protein